MTKISLDNLTVLGTTPAEMLLIAETLGFDAISPIARPSARVQLAIEPLTWDSVHTRDLRSRLRDSPVKIHNLDGFAIHPAVDWNGYFDGIYLAADLGASRIVTLMFDPDSGRGFDAFCRVCERCASVGLDVALEFTPLSQLATIESADIFLNRAGYGHAKILVDFFHLIQSGGVTADVAAISPDRICSAQICDGAMTMTAETYASRAISDREFPGDGEMPITDLLRALPRDITIGVEVPHLAMTRAGASPLERARAALAATRTALALAA